MCKLELETKTGFFSIRQQQKIIIKEDRVEFARTENTHTKSTFNISREDPRMPAWAVVQRVLWRIVVREIGRFEFAFVIR